MDYKKNYNVYYRRTIKRINHQLIKFVILSKQNKKNPNKTLNTISEFLYQKEQQWRDYSALKYPEVFNQYNNRYNEYEGDYLNNFFLYDFCTSSSKDKVDPKKISAHLGIYEALYTARINFPKSREFLEYAYALNKYFDKYSLDFSSYEDNPIKSKLFEKMQNKRYPRSQSDYEKKDTIQNEVSRNNKSELELVTLVLDDAEKLYIMHLLLQLLQEGASDMKTPEYFRILSIIKTVIPDYPSSPDAYPPNYRKVHDGLLQLPKNKIIITINNVLTKLHSIQAPILKQKLTDRLNSENKKGIKPK